MRDSFPSLSIARILTNIILCVWVGKCVRVGRRGWSGWQWDVIEYVLLYISLFTLYDFGNVYYDIISLSYKCINVRYYISYYRNDSDLFVVYGEITLLNISTYLSLKTIYLICMQKTFILQDMSCAYICRYL